MLRAAVGDKGRAGPEGLGWKAKEFKLGAEGSGEPLKVLESLRTWPDLCMERPLTFSVWNVRMSQTCSFTIKKRPACLFLARL